MQPTERIFLAVLLAHLLADFPLQSSRIVLGKRRGFAAYLQHGLIHGVVLLGCLTLFARPWIQFSPGAVGALLLYLGVHLAIDFLKQRLLSHHQWAADSVGTFLVDQALHLGSILVLVWWLLPPGVLRPGSPWEWSLPTQDRVLQAAVVFVAVVFGGGYLIRYLTRNLSTGAGRALGESATQLRNAGLYIGWLERFLILTALLMQAPSLVGLILAAKSIARFPELKEEFAEYFLIGTLLSVSIALVGALLLLKVWDGSVSLK